MELRRETVNCLGDSERLEEGSEEINEHIQGEIKGDLTCVVRHSSIEMEIGG